MNGYRSSTQSLRYIAAAGAGLLLTGCAATKLQPAPQARLLDNDTTIVTTASDDVQVTAEAENWSGEADIDEVVTPMLVTITNDSDHPIRISYEGFSLVEPGNGRRFAALPPWEVRGETRLADGYRPIAEPRLRARSFRVAPYYGSLYPGYGTFTGYGYYSSIPYYTTYYDYWRRLEIELPTPTMLKRAIPEGVIEPGGMVAGYLYFEKVQGLDRGTRLDLRTELVDAESGEIFASLDMPFMVGDMMAMSTR